MGAVVGAVVRQKRREQNMKRKRKPALSWQADDVKQTLNLVRLLARVFPFLLVRRLHARHIIKAAIMLIMAAMGFAWMSCVAFILFVHAAHAGA